MDGTPLASDRFAVRTELSSNSVVAGRFRLERSLGDGGMGTVWEATRLHTGERVALKFIKDAWADVPEMQQRVLREAQAAMAINHPNVIRVHELVHTQGGSPALVMDLLRGESLAALLEREQTLAVDELADIFLQVIGAIRAAHARGVIHRDLKPANVFLQQVGGHRVVRVLDFGVAKLATTGPDVLTELTKSGTTIGTVQYMAPEQLFGEELGPAADHWAIGVMMYECLVGRRPVEGGNLGQIVRALTHGRIVPVAQVRPHLPRPIAYVIDRMLVLDPRKRLADLAELSAALRPHALIIEERPSHAPTMLIPIPPIRRPFPWRRLRRRLRRSVKHASTLSLVLALIMASAVFVAGVFAGGAVGGP